MRSIEASAAKYIKLGEGGDWQNFCVEDGTARLGYYEVPHELGMARDRDGIRQLYLDQGLVKQVASSHARQVIDFYASTDDTIWITFANGFLYWALLEPEVEFLGQNRHDFPQGSRLRHTQSGWSNKSLGGTVLLESDLNGALTSVKSYRGTICDVHAIDYLISKINDRDTDQIIAASKARKQAIAAIKDLVVMLSWPDFELLVDLIFIQSGWRRTSQTGGSQETVDIGLMLPSTGERAFVQIKSRTTQKELEDYIARFEARSESRMFYVYHTSATDLACDNDGITLIDAEQLSKMILEAGMFDWLIERAC